MVSHLSRVPAPAHVALQWVWVRGAAAGFWSLVYGLSPSPGPAPAIYVRPPYQLRTNPNSLRLESHTVVELAFVSPHPRTAVSHPHTKRWRSPKSVWVSLSEAPPSRFQVTFVLVVCCGRCFPALGAVWVAGAVSAGPHGTFPLFPAPLLVLVRGAPTLRARRAPAREAYTPPHGWRGRLS